MAVHTSISYKKNTGPPVYGRTFTIFKLDARFAIKGTYMGVLYLTFPVLLLLFTFPQNNVLLLLQSQTCHYHQYGQKQFFMIFL